MIKTIRVRSGEGFWQGWRLCLAALAVVIAGSLFPQAAHAETRSLKLYFIHTKERAEIVYKRNGRYVQGGLDQINRFLRDWRRNEPARMDPRLLDLVWSVYRDVGARDYIHVVSAYRSPATNAALRSRSSGVANKSQHMLGKAMDFYIPGVPLSRLRAAAFRAEGGGVGYYPKSGAPFVHLDVGNVRSWPRMSRGELMALFPDGRTIHLPTDGKPLPGYQQALAAYQSRQRGGGEIAIASATSSRSGAPRRGLLAGLFGGGADEEEDAGEAVVAAAAARPAQRPAAQPAPPAAVARAPQPAQEQIIAALPERNAPLPQAAPRPRADVGPAVAALAPVPAPEAAPAVAAATALAALNVPLPTPRPNYTPAPVVAAAPVPSAPPAQVQMAASDTAALIATMSRSQEEAPPVPTVAAYAPIPTGRPAAAQVDALSLAALTLPNEPIAAADRGEAKLARLDANERTERLARLTSTPAATPKAAMLARETQAGQPAAMVRTTEKSRKPTSSDGRPDARSQQVPIPQTVARWALSNEPVVRNVAGTKAPSFAHDIVRTAPKVVYTAGFQPGGRELDANRFSGKAVQFMSVARFAAN